MLIAISNFHGVVQAVDSALLPYNYAQTAENCDLRTGRLRPLSGLLTSQTWAAGTVGDIRSIYKEESVNKWLYWTAKTKVVKVQISDGNNRIAYTGDGYPKQTDNTLFPSTGNPDATDDYRRLGVKPPTIALTIHAAHGTGDSIVKYSVSYQYTLVCKWDDGTEEESKPVAATAVVDVEGGEYLSLSGFVKPTLTASGNNVTHFRVYRLVSGYTGASYQLVKMRPASSGATAVHDLPVADVPSDTTQVYDCDATPDDLNADLGGACKTGSWDYPPDNLSQIGQYQNGILAGLSGKNFCVSEPFIHYAWPSGSRIPVSYTPVAWGVYQNTAIIATTAFPCIVLGSDADTLSQSTLPYNQGCLSARGFVITDIGAMYPSPDGLVLVNENGVSVITKNVLTKKQWEDFPPTGFDHGDLVGFYYDNVYIGFWEGSTKGFVYNFAENTYYTTFTVTDVLYSGCIDPTDDTLYFLSKISTNYFSKAWEKGIALTGTFKSKKHIVPNISFSCARVIGNQSAAVSSTVKIYGDGAQIEKNEVAWTKTVQNTNIFKLPLDTEHETYEVEISGKAETDIVLMATDPAEIIQGVKL